MCNKFDFLVIGFALQEQKEKPKIIEISRLFKWRVAVIEIMPKKLVFNGFPIYTL